MSLLASQTARDLFTMGVPVGEKIVRTVAVYLGLVLVLRLAGKRELAQLNPFDLVVLLLLSNVVQNAVIGADNSLWGGLLGAGVLVAVNAVVVRLAARNEAVTTVVAGNPTDLVVDGEIQLAALRELGLRPTAVTTAVRRQGASTLDEVARATLMPGGTIEVTLRPTDENATKGDIARLEAKLDRLLGAGA